MGRPQERSMTYDEYHLLLDPSGETAPCTALWDGEVCMPHYSTGPVNDIYDETWIYDHHTGTAFQGSAGDLIEEEEIES